MKKQIKILIIIIVSILLFMGCCLYNNYKIEKKVQSSNGMQSHQLNSLENSCGAIIQEDDIPMSELYSQSMEKNYKISQINEIEIPEKFNLMDKIKINVENQGSSPICYAYASLTSVETNLALMHNDYVDLSEYHLAYFTHKNTGGSFINADHKYYREKIGPIYEGEWLGDEVQKIEAKRYVKETVKIPSINKINSYTQEEIDTVRKIIKTHLMQYGSLYASIYSGIRKNEDNMYVLNSKFADIPDHAVSIIGWDDNFSKNNFPTSNRPKNDGAYLALNSWGENWGNNGCFWISYEDNWVESSLRGVVTVENCQRNIDIGKVIIRDKDNNLELPYKITKGINAQIEIDIHVNEVINNKEDFIVNVISPNQEDIVNKLQLSGNKIENKNAKVILNFNTSELSAGEYTINLQYNDETISIPIIINIDTYDFKINTDGSINITGYYGDEKKIIIPEKFFGFSVVGIENEAFINKDLISITIYDNIVEIGQNIINKSVIIYGNKDTYIEQYANENGYIFIPLNQQIIEGNGWYFEVENQKLNILENVSLKEYDYLKKIIKKVEIKNNINEVFNYQFQDYENLEEVILPNSINIIGENAFYNCKKLQNIDIPKEVTKIGNSAFYGCEKLKSINIPNGVTSINDYTFYMCKDLQNINISNGITRIGSKAFYKCINLENINIPEGVKTIGNEVFYECIGLSDLVIPSSVDSIGDNVFYGCIINKVSEIGISELDLPQIIKRANTNGDILNCGSGIKIQNGKLNIDKSQLIIEPGYGQITISITSGKLNGLKVIIIVSGTIEYSYDEWTYEDVTATLYIGRGEYVVNNKGEAVYKFFENGEFQFEYINVKGENKKVTAKVENIDKTMPEVTAISNKNEQGIIESITVKISDNQAGIWYRSSIDYQWNTSNTIIPSNWINASIPTFENGTNEISFEIDTTQMSGKHYLWICKKTFYDMASNGVEKEIELISPEPFYLGETPKLELTSEYYDIQNTYILGIQQNTDIKTFKNKIITNAEKVEIYNKDNEPQEDFAIIATGMKLEIKKDNQTQIYNLVIKGDIDCDGHINVYDILRLIELVFDAEPSYVWDESIRLAGKCTEESSTENPNLYDILKLIEHYFDGKEL